MTTEHTEGIISAESSHAPPLCESEVYIPFSSNRTDGSQFQHNVNNQYQRTFSSRGAFNGTQQWRRYNRGAQGFNDRGGNYYQRRQEHRMPDATNLFYVDTRGAKQFHNHVPKRHRGKDQHGRGNGMPRNSFTNNRPCDQNANSSMRHDIFRQYFHPSMLEDPWNQLMAQYKQQNRQLPTPTITERCSDESSTQPMER